ncbi:MAG: hypothetical protein BWX99_02818 [Deltaproteobacteria bacterium ADurb.Bin151]|nr:MAG: hypothetical protein BWX99_02818 [Deltaproteobacteria bacterium ADurb.Bin151]
MIRMDLASFQRIVRVSGPLFPARNGISSIIGTTIIS